MRNFSAPIETFQRTHWRRIKSASALEWSFYGNWDVIIKIKLQKTRDGWIYSVHRRGRTNYVVTVGQPVSNPNHALLSGMLWVERNFARPVVTGGGARVVYMAAYKEALVVRQTARQTEQPKILELEC